LLWQYGELPSLENSGPLHSNNLPIFPRGYTSVPLWDIYINWRVLQASIHADNAYELYLEETDGNNTLLSSDQSDCFPNFYFESASKIISKTNLNFLNKFTGCGLEMVRTFLVDWLISGPPDAPDPNWSPLLSTDSIEFSITMIFTGNSKACYRSILQARIWLRKKCLPLLRRAGGGR